MYGRLLTKRRCVPSIATQRCYQSNTATKIPFTKAEDDRILELRREKRPVSVAAAELGRTTSNVHNRLHNVLLVGGPWPEAAKPFSRVDDERILQMMREKKSTTLIATEMRRSASSTRSRMNVLLHFGGSPPGMRKFKPYSSAEDNRLMEFKRLKTPMRIIARTERRINALFLKGRPVVVRKTPYSKTDDEEIARMWLAGTKVRPIARALGRTAASVSDRLHNVVLNGGPRPVSRMGPDADPKRYFTVEEFDRIAALMAAGHSAHVVASMFHMTVGTFKDVWRRVQARPTVQRDPLHKHCTLTDEMRIMRLRTEQRLSYVQIAHETG
ncbi:hypothetical protein LTR17_016959 [Elasticomyces elasticus]|nr:hypothetical protein LTR17_016959 [Elasticomyces elasticus]